ncbi:MAG: DUF6516 family protein [Thermodesulfobacteriota bacterium]|nr:DUF6516 family protein [Thermodesulfobacteriota bacterium]
MADAIILFRAKKIYPDGAIKEMVIWQLPTISKERPHGLKYRLYYGTADGECLVRYDNETGKGDHRHLAGREEVYIFRDIESLVADFQYDIEQMKR